MRETPELDNIQMSQLLAERAGIVVIVKPSAALENEKSTRGTKIRLLCVCPHLVATQRLQMIQDLSDQRLAQLVDF